MSAAAADVEDAVSVLFLASTNSAFFASDDSVAFNDILTGASEEAGLRIVCNPLSLHHLRTLLGLSLLRDSFQRLNLHSLSPMAQQVSYFVGLEDPVVHICRK